MTVLFGPSNLIGAADTINSFLTNESVDSSEILSTNSSSQINDPKNIIQDPEVPIEHTSECSSIEQVGESLVLPDVKMSGLTLDMDENTPGADNTVNYTLTSDGSGWPSSSENAHHFSVSSTVVSGDTIKITVPRGITVQTYDIPSGTSINKAIVNDVTELTYTFSTAGVQSFNVSYFFSNQGDNKQFAPGATTLPITVDGGKTNINGSIVVNNPLTSNAIVRTHNTAVSNNIYTTDGESVYNFVMGVKTDPDFTKMGSGITQANHAKMSGVIHVPAGFVLVGGSLANYKDTNENIPSDGSAIPSIPEGLSQPGGPGTDIVVSNVVGGGYETGGTSYNEAYIYLYGYFAENTDPGTYHFAPDLTITPQYYDGTIGNVPVQPVI